MLNVKNTRRESIVLSSVDVFPGTTDRIIVGDRNPSLAINPHPRSSKDNSTVYNGVYHPGCCISPPLGYICERTESMSMGRYKC